MINYFPFMYVLDLSVLKVIFNQPFLIVQEYKSSTPIFKYANIIIWKILNHKNIWLSIATVLTYIYYEGTF